MMELKLTPIAGTDIHECAKDACRVASALRVAVTFEFNGYVVQVADIDQPGEVVRRYLSRFTQYRSFESRLAATPKVQQSDCATEGRTHRLLADAADLIIWMSRFSHFQPRGIAHQDWVKAQGRVKAIMDVAKLKG